ncbi:MAG: adenylate/guanylate cyclase domain-containing protein [Treponema sp.]|nr:adenylate/guanylate cyclase domain-containing protein [Treponema sp.]MBQ7168254.1 adenylate/guanylate cyclase domain-containing protein [Treponema sp.]
MKPKAFFLKHHIYFYGLICLLANMLAVLSTDLTECPMPEGAEFAAWARFSDWLGYLRASRRLVSVLGIICYAVPVLLCFLYVLGTRGLPHDDKRYVQVMVNIPGAFALRGISGWVCNFVMEMSLMVFFGRETGLDVTFIAVYSVFSYVFLATLSFTIIYFTLETLNRSFVLPLMYPEGRISGTARMSLSSIRSLFLFYFCSAALFPSVFLGSRLYLSSFYGLSSRDGGNFVFAGIILFLGLSLTILLMNFFRKPLRWLTAGAREISAGNYESRTVICSNDEMGVLGDAFNEMAASLKEKEFMRDTFGKVVTPQVRDYLLQGNAELGGRTLDVTVMFCDIRGFTSLSETMPPPELVSLLNEYFTGLEKCIRAHGGVINKYIGDAVMALFGAPVPSAHHARDAFAAAQDMRRELSLMNRGFAARGLPRLRFGISLHSGPVLAGNIGAASRMEYTVIGDTVNTASRIEGLCKQYGRDLLVSGSTERLLGGGLEFVDEADIRGRKGKVRLYTDGQGTA